MDVVIVYESIYGNTRQVAEAIGEGVREADPDAHVELLRVADARPEHVVDARLVVVGGPTHVLGMSRPSSRQEAVHPKAAEREKAPQPEVEPGAEGPGIREWLDALPPAGPGHVAAAFDTRMSTPLAGGAARPIARHLRRHGFAVTSKPRGFVVTSGEGPLRAGELDRARAWGAELARQAVHHQAA